MAWQCGAVLPMQKALCYLHDKTGLGWTSTIVLSAIGVKLLILPFEISHSKKVARLENLQPELKRLAPTCARDILIEKTVLSMSDEDAEKKFKNLLGRRLKVLLEKNNCKPQDIKALKWTSAVLTASSTYAVLEAINYMAYMLPVATGEAMIEQQYRFVQMMMENSVFFESLVTRDTFVLPAVTVFAMLADIEITRATSWRPLSHKATLICHFLAGLVGFAASLVPRAASLYLATSLLCTLGVTVLSQFSALRSIVGIPETPTSKAAELKRKKFFKRVRVVLSSLIRQR